MKYWAAVVLASSCTFSASEYRCEDTDEPRSGFECLNRVWVQVQDVGQGSTVDMESDFLVSAICGNGSIEGFEQCDGLTFNNTCESLNFESGTLSCTESCHLNTANCKPKSTCGNGKIDDGEDCEKDQALEATCLTAGNFMGGTLGCSDACTFDTSQCQTCGNNFLEPGERCDGTELGNADCSTALGYRAKGTLSCKNDCSEVLNDQCSPVFTQVAAGFNHTCGLKSDGKVVCWGADDRGQTSNVPGDSFNQISSGDKFSCGLLKSQEIKCWGNNRDQELESPTGRFTDLSLGYEHGCAITDGGSIQCWGDDSRFFAHPTTFFDQISIWQDHGCARKGDEIECWGNRDLGELMVPPNIRFKSVSVGHQFSCGLTVDDEIECWGKTSPRIQSPEGKFIAVDSGSYHTCAIESGTNLVHCWGDENGRDELKPPSGDLQYRQISAGDFHTCAVQTNGDIQCWGQNSNGESTPPKP